MRSLIVEPIKKKTYHKVEKPWDYIQFKHTPTVICAERKVLWYDVNRLRAIARYLKKKKCRFFWDDDEPDKYRGYVRHKCRVQIYKKYPEDMPFQDKIKDLKTIIDTIKFDNVPNGE